VSALITFEDRPSDSPFVERVWRCHSERAGTFVSVAASHLELVISRREGREFVTLRGPETKPTQETCPADGQWVGIRFRIGTYFPHHPASALIDRQDEDLRAASCRSFWLDDHAWEYFDLENAETFVARLVRSGVIRRDGAVQAVVQGERDARSRRSAQRHFVDATGVTHRTFRQIERARHATNLLRQGASILDTVHAAGYFDQAHLTRSLTSFIGQTPGRILRGERQLSFLYKTTPPAADYDAVSDTDDERIGADRATHRKPR
jgi:AraC-like DNA-binding protein